MRHSHSPIPMFHFLKTTFSPTAPNPCLSFRLISTTLHSNDHSFTVSYLINTFGFSPQRAASLSKHINFETREKPDSVIQFFNNLGFSHTQLLTVISTVPQYLLSDPHKTFNPKIDFFKSKGFSNSDIPNIISRNPDILRRSLEKQIIPTFDFFNAMFPSKHKFMKTIIRYSGILCDLDRTLVPNMNLLRQEGVPESLVVRFIEYFPRALTARTKHLKDIVEELKELGFNPLMLNFVVAIHVKIWTRSVWKRKEGIYKRWGWNDNDIRAAFRLHPFCMSTSDSKIEAVMDFLVNKLGCAPSAIARCPVMMSMSLEKRIIPRGSVILVLLSKGLVNELSLSTMFKSVEKVFLDKFIYCHEKEADELFKLYQAILALPRS